MTVAWPHEPAAADYHATEARSWRNRLSADGSRVTTPAGDEPQDVVRASARGTANDLVVALYGRIPLDSLGLAGIRQLFDQLVEWDPER